jgi:hypothetical protein
MRKWIVRDYSSGCLAVMASESIRELAYSSIEPVAMPLAKA